MTDEIEEERSNDPRFPLPAQEPTRGPVDYQEAGTVGPQLAGHLEDPTRRRHPTILSEEGEEEAPASELRPPPRPEPVDDVAPEGGRGAG